MKKVFDDQVFERYDISDGLEHEFSGCTFKNCDFSEALFNNAELIECEFISCNLSNVNFENTILNQVKFSDCKIIGVDFGKCSKFLFTVSFANCMLNYSLFYKNELKGTSFQKCVMQEVTFIEANLTSAKFLACDLDKSVFDHNNLERTDFSTSFNYGINPEINRLKKTKFSMPEVIGLLNFFDIEIIG